MADDKLVNPVVDFWINLGLGIVLAFLQGLANSPNPPQFAPQVLHILTEIRDLLNRLIPPTVTTFTA